MKFQELRKLTVVNLDNLVKERQSVFRKRSGQRQHISHAPYCLLCKMSPASLCFSCNTLQNLNTNIRPIKTPKPIKNRQVFKISPRSLIEQAGMITSSHMPVKHLTSAIIPASILHQILKISKLYVVIKKKKKV